MTTNAIAISRGLVGAGLEQKAADAIAEAVVTHSDERFATKADIARLEGELKGEIRAVAAQVKLLTGLVAGLYLGLAMLFVDRLVG